MQTCQTTARRLVALAITTVMATALAACNTSGNAGPDDGSYTIAVLAASSQNGYNQAVYEGVKKKAEELGGIELKLLDGQFSADTQLSQLENAGVGEEYDGVVVVPNDGPGLAAAMPLANTIPVVTVLNPIGPDIEQMQLQTEGVVATVAVPPSAAAAKQAEGVVEYCADKDPCQVLLLVGQLNAPLDVAREKAYRTALEQHDNIKIIQTVEGNYDRDTSLTAVSNVLQSNPDLDVILSNADQQTSGAQVAVENAGIEPSSIYLTGGGGTKESVENVRKGIWQADYINFPVSMGEAAMEQLHNSLTGKEVTAWVDADKVGGIEPYATAETLKKTPDFVGEWVG